MSTRKGEEEVELIGKLASKSVLETNITEERGQTFGGQGVAEVKGPSGKGVTEAMSCDGSRTVDVKGLSDQGVTKNQERVEAEGQHQDVL